MSRCKAPRFRASNTERAPPSSRRMQNRPLARPSGRTTRRFFLRLFERSGARRAVDHLEARTLLRAHDGLICLEILPGHAMRREALLEARAHALARQGAQA